MKGYNKQEKQTLKTVQLKIKCKSSLALTYLYNLHKYTA